MFQDQKPVVPSPAVLKRAMKLHSFKNDESAVIESGSIPLIQESAQLIDLTARSTLMPDSELSQLVILGTNESRLIESVTSSHETSNATPQFENELQTSSLLKKIKSENNVTTYLLPAKVTEEQSASRPLTCATKPVRVIYA